MSKGGSHQQPAGNTTTNTVQNSAPWSAQQPYLQGAFQSTQALNDAGELAPQYFPGQTLASTSPYTNQGISGLAGAAGANQGVQNAASNLTTNTLNGSFLSPQSNPYLDQTYGQAADQLQGQMRSAFGGSDVNPNTNSSLQAAMGTGLANLGNQIYGGNYQAERQRQDQALALAPGTQQAAFMNPSQLLNAGQTQQGVQQQQINDQINRYNYNQNLPMYRLQNYEGLINGNYGQSATTTQTQPYFGPSTGANVMGGALAGGALGNMFGYPGTGAAMGGLMGKIQ